MAMVSRVCSWRNEWYVTNVTETSVRRCVLMLFGMSACRLWINIVLWGDFNLDMIMLDY